MITEELGKLLMDSLMSVGYNKLNKEDKNRLVNYIAQKEGALLTEITEEYIFNMIKRIRINELSEICQETILQGFKSPNGHIYRTNRDDQINMIGQKSLLELDKSIETVQWKTEDVGYLVHDREGWIRDIYMYGMKFKASQLFKYDHLKKRILQAETEEDILIVAWDMDVEIESPLVTEESNEDVETPIEEPVEVVEGTVVPE